MMRLPEELEQQLWQDIGTLEENEKKLIVPDYGGIVLLT